MPTSLIQPEFLVEIDYDKCHKCGRCVQQCGWGVYSFNERPFPDDTKCRACHRCVTYCPAHCITIKKNDLALRDNANWTSEQRKNVWRQAESGGVMLTGMGNDKPYQSIFDHLVLDACQVTNPSIDPLREPMELRTYLGRKPDSVEVESDGNGGFRLKEGAGVTNNVKLDTPIIFSPMSYGSVSLNVHKSLAMAAERLGILMNTGEGGLHADLYPYQDNVIVQVASGRFGVNPEYLRRGAAIEIKVGQGAKPGIGGHLPGEKINKEVSTTRMIPQGSDAISPGAAPRHLLDRGPAPAHLLAQGGVGLQAGRRQDRGRAQRRRHRVGHRARGRGLRLPRRLQGRHRRGAGDHPRPRRHPARDRDRGRRPASARRGHPQPGLDHRRRLDPVLGRHGQGDRARRRRRGDRLGVAHGARLPPVPGLPHRLLHAGA